MTDFGSHNAILTFNLTALKNNYRHFQKQVGQDCRVAGVIKANAYGTGLTQISHALKQLQCPQFFVANLDEALAIREQDKTTPIAVLGGLMTHEDNTYTHHDIVPVLNTPIDIKNWNSHAQNMNAQLPAIIHTDTAMNRLGLSAQEFKNLSAQDLSGLDVQWVMSHFASADDVTSDLTQQQHDRFEALPDLFPTAKKSLANSSGLFRSPSYHYDMVRPGYGLYGGNPTPEKENPMQNVVALEARILQIRECKKGETIGYGATHKFNQDTRTATIGLGYADGFFRAHGNNHGNNKAVVYYNNQACRVIGRISMDLVTIDISNIADKPPEQGQSVEVIGHNQTIDDLAETAGTIGYEILTSLGNRYKRIYVDND